MRDVMLSPSSRWFVTASAASTLAMSARARRMSARLARRRAIVSAL